MKAKLTQESEGWFKQVIQAGSLSFSGKWMTMTPTFQFRMPEGAFKNALRYRLGMRIISRRARCDMCNGWVDTRGIHTGTCPGAHQRRHNRVCKVAAQEIRRAQLVVDEEPQHLMASDGRRPDLLIHNFQNERPMCLDVTIVSSFKGSDFSEPGVNVKDAEARKLAKYESDLAEKNIDFAPFAMETVGGFGEKSLKFLEALGSSCRDIAGLPAKKAIALIRNKIQFQWMRDLGIALVSLARHVDHPHYGWE